MKLVRILILEDDLFTQAALLSQIAVLEHEHLSSGKNIEIATTILSEYTQVDEYINKLNDNYFDIVLLDRDCKA